MPSHMHEVAKILGVDFDKYFNIKGFDGSYKLTHIGLDSSDSLLHKRSSFGDSMLVDLLLGDCQIVYKWKPQEGDKIFMPCFDEGYVRVYSENWYEPPQSKEHYESLLNANLVCKTEDAARKKGEKMLAILKEVNK